MALGRSSQRGGVANHAHPHPPPVPGQVGQRNLFHLHNPEARCRGARLDGPRLGLAPHGLDRRIPGQAQ